MTPPSPAASDSPRPLHEVRAVKRLVARLHAALRDTDAASSILDRFDQLTRLLFLKQVSEQEGERLFALRVDEDTAAYAGRIRAAYAARTARYPDLVPLRFATLAASDAALAQCGALLDGVTFRGAGSDVDFDVAGVAYEEVIRDTFDRSDHQQFFTPYQIVRFMVAALRPLLSERSDDGDRIGDEAGQGCVIADPACGTAGFLAELVRSGVPYRRLVGLEIDERLAWVAGMNLALHGGERFAVRHLDGGGALGEGAAEYVGALDAITTNPPFGSDLGEPALLERFELGRGRNSRRRGILFLERCHAMLREGGVLGIVLDEGVLSLPTTADVRRFVLERFDLLGVVSLPESAFMPYATVNAAMLFLRKRGGEVPARSRRVFYGRADTIGRKGNGDDDFLYDESGGARLASDLPELLEAWLAVTRGEALPESERAFVADVVADLAGDPSVRLDLRYHEPARKRSAQLLAGAARLMTVAELCDERSESMLPAEDAEGAVILYTGLADIEPRTGVVRQWPTPAASIKSPVKRYEPGDVLFARLRPNLRKVAYVHFREGGYVSPECVVLTVRRGDDGRPLLDPALLAALLRSDLVYGQITHQVAGIGRPRLNARYLRQVRLPVAPKGVQEAARHELAAAEARARAMQQEIARLQAECAALSVSAVELVAERMIGDDGRLDSTSHAPHSS